MFRRLLSIVAAIVMPTIAFPLWFITFFTVGVDASYYWVRFWGRGLLWAGGARLVVDGLEHVDPKRPTIYVANHQSTVDIPALFVALPVNFRYVAKQQLKHVPFIGWYLTLAGHVFVDRRNRSSAIQSLEKAGAQIRAGTSIAIFGEGTRSDDCTVLPFKKGPFALALAAKVPICPVTIEGSGEMMPKNSWRIRPRPIYVRVGAPIETAHYDESQREQLIKVVRDAIIEQSLALGGKGGDRKAAIAIPGLEGVADPAASDRIAS